MQQHRSTAAVPILQARRVSKSFAGVKALVDVSLPLEPGEVHALMGENGAGKSTLMKVLAGLHPPDSGEILLRGKPIVLRSPHEAIANGIAMIHQELMPIPDLTVAENILLGHEPASRWLGWIDRRACTRGPAALRPSGGRSAGDAENAAAQCSPDADDRNCQGARARRAC